MNVAGGSVYTDFSMPSIDVVVTGVEFQFPGPTTRKITFGVNALQGQFLKFVNGR